MTGHAADGAAASPAACAVEVVISGVPARLTYVLDEPLSDAVIGSEVAVELGRRRASGWIVGVLSIEEAQERFRSLRAAAPEEERRQLAFFDEHSVGAVPRFKPVLERHAAFRPGQLPLFEWMAEYYGVSLAEVIDNAVPKRTGGRTLQTVEACREEAAAALDQLRARAPKQAMLLEQLLAAEKPLPVVELEQSSGSTRAALKSLLQKKLIRRSTADARQVLAEQVGGQPGGSMFSGITPDSLTTSQEAACRRIAERLGSRAFSPILLLGVTGSGKTEVYIRAVQDVLSNGGSAMLIVPEISLTPQLLDQLEARLETPLALLHSQVGASARWAAWEDVLSGACRVAIGARSAIFAPLENLRLIIVDEEHEGSYKQSDGLRYHGRDVAVMRAKFAGCTAILGSATPSLESLLNVQRKRYELIELPERVTNRPLPKLEIIDLTKVRRSEMPSENISPKLYAALSAALASGEQAVVLYNKRGFSSYLQCDTCGEAVSCPECSVTLTYHKGRKRLLCHYCGQSSPPPEYCPICRDPATTAVEAPPAGEETVPKSKTEKVGKMSYRGSGTEHVIEELADLFPEARLVRMDRDTVGRKDSYRRILGSMRSGDADILVGTQMIAKGHDLPGVTLVGIIDADVGLHFPDFRTSERTYQLITQAAGRAGRGSLPGRVLVQTREADHPTIVATATGRFKAFARYQLEQRKALGYPPVGRLLRLVASSSDRREAQDAARETRRVLDSLSRTVSEENGARVAVLGPAPAPHERLRGRFRWHLLVKSSSASALSRIAAALNTWRGQTSFKDFRLAVDVDPVDML